MNIALFIIFTISAMLIIYSLVSSGNRFSHKWYEIRDIRDGINCIMCGSLIKPINNIPYSKCNTCKRNDKIKKINTKHYIDKCKVLRIINMDIFAYSLLSSYLLIVGNIFYNLLKVNEIIILILNSIGVLLSILCSILMTIEITQLKKAIKWKSQHT